MICLHDMTLSVDSVDLSGQYLIRIEPLLNAWRSDSDDVEYLNIGESTISSSLYHASLEFILSIVVV